MMGMDEKVSGMPTDIRTAARALDPDVELIKLPEVKRITSLSQSAIYAKAASGVFPKQVKLGPNTVAWVKHEVLAWVHERINLREAC